MDSCLIISAGNQIIPDLMDELLFIHFKATLLELLNDADIVHFGMPPDNTADNNDELLMEGKFFRIISYLDTPELELDSTSIEILSFFKNLVENHSPFWGSVIIEKGFITTETTIEFIFK